MQGGHPDGLRLRNPFKSEPAGSDGESSGYDSEIVVSKALSLGRKADRAVAALRRFVNTAFCLPICWLHFEPSVSSFRKRKRRSVEQGTSFVLSVQKMRSSFLDVYMQIFSFFGEEEWYLLLLPTLFWNVSDVLARQLTLLICVGLLLGNTMKDVFELPRPSCPPVWRPSNAAAMDSSALQDFGFPSTHSMNAVTNSWYVFLYLRKSGVLEGPATALGLLVCTWWTISLMLSRLYLGAHTPTDVRGGTALGIAMLIIFWRSHEAIDDIIFNMSSPLVKCIASIAFILLVCPQPRPPTPTFNQNATLAGLLFGCILGCRWLRDDLGAVHNSEGALAEIGRLAPFVRTVIGYALVLIARVLVKSSLVALLKSVGIHVNPSKIPPKGISEEDSSSERPMKEKNRQRRRRKNSVSVRLFTRDIDILFQAIVKCFVYFILACSITFAVPRLHLVLGCAAGHYS